MPRLASSASSGLCTSRAASAVAVVVEPRHRRVGAHAARVGARVAVADALEVLRGGERPRRLAVAEREQRDLLADQQLLDHDRAPGLAERPADEAGLDGGQRALAIGADGDALAGREAVGLDDARAAELVDGTPCGRRRPAGHVARRRHAGGDASASSRTPSSPRRARRRTTGRRRGCAPAAGRLRARARAAARARSRPARPRGGGPARTGRRRSSDGHVVAGRDARDARIAGRAMQFATGGARGERLRQRVLPPARADEQDPHRGESKRSRRLRRTARSRPAGAARAPPP